MATSSAQTITLISRCIVVSVRRFRLEREVQLKTGASAPDRAWKENSSSNNYPKLKSLMCHDCILLAQTEVMFINSILDPIIALTCLVKI